MGIVALTLAAVVSLPYLVPAPLSISRSYISGFSNRTAILLFLLGTAILAAFTHGLLARTEAADSRLSPRVLLAALLVTLADCLHLCRFSANHLPGGEAEYFLNRLQMLASGQAPYRQFEFVYGPLLLYPIYWTQHLLHLTSTQAYILTWILFWQLGVVMVWIVLREIDLPLPSRRGLFAFLVLAQLAFAGYGGLSYSPLRAYCAAFCIALTHKVWTRSRNAWFLALCAVLAVALALCCSVDQAVAVVLGLFAWMLLLTLAPHRLLPPAALAATVLGTLACFALAAATGLLEPLRSFGGGGYSYPLLPSPAILLTLFAYMVSGCLLYRAVQTSLTNPAPSLPNSAVIPLTLAGCAMLPAALGRCDVLHITAATPAFVVGVAAISTMPVVRRWWLPLAVLCLILIPLRISRILDLLHVTTASPLDPALAAQGFTTPLDDNQWYISPAQLSSDELPCDRQYFSPSFMPVPTRPFRPSCLDTGYYLGYTDVITPSTIERKIAELRSRPSTPLLMENTPLEAQLPLQLASNRSLFYESESFWIPPVRHAPLTYAPILDYIRQHYVPGPEQAHGRLRLWYPATPIR